MEHILSDFKKGDRVYHLSHKQFEVKQEMIVTYIQTSTVLCSWITSKGDPHEKSFYPFELEKVR